MSKTALTDELVAIHEDIIELYNAGKKISEALWHKKRQIQALLNKHEYSDL